ncbi:hypothetical protein H6G33_35390 [Calothrix sp. FACHB-1219]|uniref:hypothetical protein n=1 Tax=unclassified Calothrix TaxID=2619626 RepID=UPI0016873DBB|nr:MULTISPECIES: hypothetical protein [unclassified Calothrix]MBD2207617.1 hypothetical protein [Calothrix sp. FACHB-168]MBD2222218.1 hypothetical protein [Calothrix sp. FACHB-1219]
MTAKPIGAISRVLRSPLRLMALLELSAFPGCPVESESGNYQEDVAAPHSSQCDYGSAGCHGRESA